MLRWKKVKNISFLPIVVSYMAKLYVLLVWVTSRVNYQVPDSAKEILISKRSCIVSLWHAHIFIMPYFMSRYGIFNAVVSNHKDGIFLAEYLKRYGHRIIFGSSNRQSLTAIRGVLKALRDGQRVAITPDGPRGPRYKVGGNIIAIANKTNLPILVLSVAYSRKIVLNTWDKFLIPLPFGRIYIEISSPIKVLKNNLEEVMISRAESAELKVNYAG
jgi:lysophospholipid acyltransferase (LPLAT)-like uncharacterized protein